MLTDELRDTSSRPNLDDPKLAQPLCTALQIALVDLLASWHVFPQAVQGHSSGEIAAAYCAGGLTKESALRVAYFRGANMASLLVSPLALEGTMIAVGLSEAELAPYLEAVNAGQDETHRLTCGCVNGLKNTTVTGDTSRIDVLARRLATDMVFARKLNVPVAYHSSQMSACADGYRCSLEGYLVSGASDFRKPSPAFYSSVTGGRMSSHHLSEADYWVTNLVSQVKFAQALQMMCSENSKNGVNAVLFLLEIGPHCTLERSVRETVPEEVAYIYDSVLRRNVCDVENARLVAGRLVANGYPIDLQAVNRHRDGRRQPKMLVDLPRYPFNHSQSYWLESRLFKNIRNRQRPRHELLGSASEDWSPLKPKWRLVIRESDLPWITDHKVLRTLDISLCLTLFHADETTIPD